MVKVEVCRGFRSRRRIGVKGKGIGQDPLPIRLRDLRDRRELSSRVRGSAPGEKNMVHFISRRTHQVKGKFNLFIDNYSDTYTYNFKNQLKTTN